MTVKELIDKLQQFDEAVPMTAREANDKGYRIGNHSFEEDGYEVTYHNGYKSWSPAKEFEKAYYKLEDPAGDVLKENDIKRFIKAKDKIWEGLGFVLQWAKYGLKK